MNTLPQDQPVYQDITVTIKATPHTCTFWYVCDGINPDFQDIEVGMSAQQYREYDPLFQPGHLLLLRGWLHSNGYLELDHAEFQRNPD